MFTWVGKNVKISAGFVDLERERARQNRKFLIFYKINKQNIPNNVVSINWSTRKKNSLIQIVQAKELCSNQKAKNSSKHRTWE